MASKVRSLLDPQLPLMPARKGPFDDDAAEFLAILVQALRDNGVSQETLAHATNKDPSHLSRMLGGKGAHPSPDVIMAILGLDAKGVAISWLAEKCGREAIEKKPDPVAENKVLRAQLEAVYSELGRVLKRGSP